MRKFGFLLAVLIGCKPVISKTADYYYLNAPKDKREQLKSLFILLNRAQEKEERFSLVSEIANTYLKMKQFGKLANFLAERIEGEPDNPYNAYYLLMTAYTYMMRDASQTAALYFEIILKNYPDLIVEGKSIHLICLNQLIGMTDNPYRLAKYYRELIARFPKETDLGAAYFMLGQAYERTGDWRLALKAYSGFRKLVEENHSFNTVSIPFPNAEQYAARLVAFDISSKDWTFETLNGLVHAVKSALAEGNSSQLWRYHAKVNFFVRSWAHDETDDSGLAGAAEFNLPDFMRRAVIKYAENLDPASNATEAYLRTWGWTQYISTWYLYFRKIYFPSDPKMHGRWEWAGVYYGEKF